MPIPEVEKIKKQLIDEDKETLAEQAAAYQFIMNSVNGFARYWMQNIGDGFAAVDRMGEEHMGKLAGIDFDVKYFRVQESKESIERDQNIVYEQAGISSLSPKALQNFQQVQMYEPKKKYREDKPINHPELSEEDLAQGDRREKNQQGV